MSGITGMYRVDGRCVDPETLQRMTDLLAHRGSDDANIWHAGPIGLGHRMLWTTPESLHEHLPLISDDGRYALTADARIDNRDELITAIGFSPPAGTITDSDLIFHAYKRWGKDSVDHLLGDFAFALWDADNQSLFCARDHMGIKPFYYYCSDALFTFASEMKALFCLPEVPRQINEKQVAFCVAERHIDDQETSYQEVRRLPAAHAITISPTDVQLRQYWVLDPTRELHLNSDAEYEKAFREVFTEAVRCRLRSAYPIGYELSGGLDSTSVVGVALHLLQQDATHLPLQTFSVIYDDVPECDERSYINAMAASRDIELGFVPGDQQNPFADIEHKLWHEEEPFHITPNLFPYWSFWDGVRDSGARILMSGYGGDIVVSFGERSLLDLARKIGLFPVLKEVCALSKNDNVPIQRELWDSIVAPFAADAAPGFVRKVWRKVRKADQSTLLATLFIRSDFAERTGLLAYLQALQEATSHCRTSRELHYEQLTNPFGPYLLEGMEKAAAAFSLEYRYPFYDRRVVEFCLALPPEQKIRYGYTRSIVRRALAAYLPVEVQRRMTKATADPNINRALSNERARIEGILFRNSAVIEPYIDIDSLRKAYPKFVNGENGGLTRTWVVVALALWLAKKPDLCTCRDFRPQG